MPIKDHIHTNRIKKGLLICGIGLVLLLAACLEIVQINQPSSVGVGEAFTITLDVEITDDLGSTLVFGFLAPRAWKAAENTTVSFTSDIGNSTMSLMPPDELELENDVTWKDAITERVGFGSNYGEMEWIVYKADNSFTPPGSTSESDPVNGVIKINTRAGSENLITQLGYFLGEADWGYLNDNNNSTFSFFEECIEVTGGSGQAQNLCGPAPRKLVIPETYTFDDLITIVFDAQEDSTALIGASKVFFCSQAVHDAGITEICEISGKTEMMQTGPDIWSLTFWPRSYYDLSVVSEIGEILCSFQDEGGNIIVKAIDGNDFQILAKCF